MRNTSPILAVLLTLAIALTVVASDFPGPQPSVIPIKKILINSTNIQEFPFFVSVYNDLNKYDADYSHCKHFEVVIDPQPINKLIILSDLIINDEHTNVIAQWNPRGQPLAQNENSPKPNEKKFSEKSVSFEFSIATNYLATSKFFILCQSTNPQTDNGTSYFYRFDLKDLARDQ